MNASDVIIIGRKRKRQASNVAEKPLLPSLTCASLANSTIKIAFLLAKPIKTKKPICVKTFISSCAILTPTSEQSKHIGTTNTIANGSDQLS